MKFNDPAATFESNPQPRISLSGFDVSHRHTTTFDMGEVIPVALLEVVPNDRWDLGVNTVLRMQPLVAPILHPVKLKVQAWFIPNRLLMDKTDPDLWERFITGGDDGLAVPSLPLFDPTAFGAQAANMGSLWDRFGYNPLFDASATSVAVDCLPLVFPHRAYSKLWNDWFRIPGIQPEVDIFGASMFVRPFFENWPRDYFTSALPFLQRGVSPSLPVLGSIASVGNFSFSGNTAALPGGFASTMVQPNDTSGPRFVGATGSPLSFSNSPLSGGGLVNATNSMNAAFDDALDITTTSTLSTVDTRQIRLAFLYQAFLERMARGGARYAEMLPNIWGARPLDQRLNRAEFIGGFTQPWLTSEVLQTAPQTDNGTSGDTTPQGTMAGHGINLASGNLGKYQVSEHGFIIVTACTYPDSMYQQGLPRSVLRRTREEFPSPAFAGLSEQEIFNAELFNQTVATDPTGAIGRTPFGYTGRYNEMRFQPSIVTSEMRDVFDYWHLGRKFSALPVLNTDFVNMVSENDANNFKRVFAVQNVPGIIGTFGVTAHVVRPLPFMAVPAQLGGS